MMSLANRLRSRPQSRRGRSLEGLEPRQLLAGDTVTLLPDQVFVYQNAPLAALNVLGNDVFGDDYTGAREISAVSFGSEGGRIEISGDRKSVLYAPPADFAGEEQFSYFVDGSFFAMVKVDVRSPLEADGYELPPDGQVHQLNVLENDPFWPGYSGPKRITLVSVTTGQSEAEIAADGKSILYRPSELASGTDKFLYIVDELYSVMVTVETPAVLAHDVFEVLQNTPSQHLDVLGNDPFWDGYDGPRKITFVSPLQTNENASIEIADNGKSLLYTSADELYGYDQFYYVVDGRFEANVDLHIERPVVDDYFEIDINSQDHSLDVLSNDEYWSYLQRRYVDVVDRVTAVGESANGGTLSVQADGRGIIYSAPAGFSGTDTFTYVADDRFEALVTVDVTRPVRGDYLTAYQDTPNQQLPVLENDFVGNGYIGPRRLTSVTATEQNAVISVVASAVQYTPPEGFAGRDAFAYTVDGQLDAHVTVSVIPLAQNDSYQFCAQPNDTYTLDVFNNDYFHLGYQGAARITAVEMTEGGGQASISADGRSIRYQPGSQIPGRINYTVDGKYMAQAVVWRENHLQSDSKVVDQNADAALIDVLSNDFPQYFWRCRPADYTGPHLITGVTASKHGGTVTISADQRSLKYKPAEDFYGTDQFAYVVDGTMEATVQVQVIRRVRDDQVRVRPGQTDVLTVVANDVFGANYQGAQKITHVTGSTIGATVAISLDGRQLLYTAPAEFTGKETLTYTVDGRLKANVEIDVRPDGESPFGQFGSLEEFQQYLVQDALVRYADRFGQIAYDSRAEGAGPVFDGPQVDSAGRDFSETNVQVAGIDEGDIVEFDEDYVYFLTGDEVVILDAWPAEQLHEVSRTPIVGSAIAQYLHGDRLTVISQVVIQHEPNPFDDPGVPFDLVAPMDFFPRWPRSYQTIVTVLDVTDRTSLQLVQRTTFDGQYVQSRGIGDYVYVALSNSSLPPGPHIIPNEEWDPNSPGWGPVGTYETQEQYLARVQANMGEFVDEALPNYTSVGPDGQLVRSGLLHEPEDIFRPISEGAASLVSLVSINVNNSQPGLAGTSSVYTNGATKIYASLEHFYLFENGYESEDGDVTRILQFDWNADDGSARFSAAGLVPGYMLNQFSADEYDGHLRIVTTVRNRDSGTWTSNSENDLFVLRNDGGVLEFTGSLQNLGLGESARAARFMGPRAFLVTFREVDPLFAIDVSDPAAPKSIGHLTLPGFSSYMQFIDDNHLLTVGQNTPTGTWGPAQVSLFDVTDLTQPRLVDEYTMERYSQTEAAADHHAFGYFARHKLLAVPSVRSYVVRTDEDQDGYAETRQWVTDHELMVFRIDVDAEPGTSQAVQLVAEIAHDSAVRRSGYIDDKLFSIADDSIHVVDVGAPGAILATAADLQHEPPEPPPMEVWAAVDVVLRQVREDLAERLSLAEGAVMPVVVEPTADGWKSVVRVDDVYFQYDVQAESVALVDAGFEFGAAGEPVSWQNPTDAADVNRDGQVTPSDATLIVERLDGKPRASLPSERVVRQIDHTNDPDGRYWDVNGDGAISPADALAVIQRFNATALHPLDTGSLSIDDPSTLSDIAAVEAFFARVLGRSGDANLDGRFNSSDLVLIFQRGKYEDAIPDNARWDEGDWDGDGDFTTSDLVVALAYGRYS
jgi:uncharacterized secreted protein with C-terminal beta-propeller domain